MREPLTASAFIALLWFISLRGLLIFIFAQIIGDFLNGNFRFFWHSRLATSRPNSPKSGTPSPVCGRWRLELILPDSPAAVAREIRAASPTTPSDTDSPCRRAASSRWSGKSIPIIEATSKRRKRSHLSIDYSRRLIPFLRVVSSLIWQTRNLFLFLRYSDTLKINFSFFFCFRLCSKNFPFTFYLLRVVKLIFYQAHVFSHKKKYPHSKHWNFYFPLNLTSTTGTHLFRTKAERRLLKLFFFFLREVSMQRERKTHMAMFTQRDDVYGRHPSKHGTDTDDGFWAIIRSRINEFPQSFC